MTISPSRSHRLTFIGALAVLMFSIGIGSGATELPADSLYQSQSHWTNSQHQHVMLPSFVGKPQILAFVYSHCLSMCPVIVADLQRVEQKLAVAERERVTFTLITLDPDRDTPDTMATFMRKHQLSTPRWQFLRGSADDTRELALLFNVKYRQEGEEIAHSNTISVLDVDGRLAYQRVGIGGLDAVVAAVQNALKQ
jgi:protein SCO1